MIELGLSRITRLLSNTALPWKAIHVAGTNGKGSVCAYASSMLRASNIRCGRFTSPHLIDRWDCITIDELPVNSRLFFDIEAVVKARDRDEGIGASEFEILTATAFEVFNRENIEVGVVEAGLGGRHDATNVLRRPTVTVITKIGEDHQAFLGPGVEAIAHHKAGIMKAGTPCFVDGSNSSLVLDVFEREARLLQSITLLRSPQDLTHIDHELQEFFDSNDLMAHQKMNIQLAYQAVSLTLAVMSRPMDTKAMASAIETTEWPGRLQIIDLREVLQHEQTVLLDGAHNSQSATVLAAFVEAKLRTETSSITWIVGFSDGKDAQAMLATLLRPDDNVVALAFGSVDGMPWVHAMNPANILEAAERACPQLKSVVASKGLMHALQVAVQKADDHPIVITGSLYLVSDVLRLLRSKIK